MLEIWLNDPAGKSVLYVLLCFWKNFFHNYLFQIEVLGYLASFLYQVLNGKATTLMCGYPIELNILHVFKDSVEKPSYFTLFDIWFEAILYEYWDFFFHATIRNKIL